jgi:hypothetical protein
MNRSRKEEEKEEKNEEERITLKEVLDGKIGNRARFLRIAREGLPQFDGSGIIHGETPSDEINSQAIRSRKRDIIQLRACVALGWTRDQILEETNWNLQRLMCTERYLAEEDRRIWEKADPIAIFAEYREHQILCAKELEDLAMYFKDSRQFSSLVGAVKAKSDVLDKIIKVGQELGVVKRAAKEISIRGQVDVRTLSVAELRVHLEKEVSGLQKLLESPPRVRGPAGAVLKRILPAKSEDIENFSSEAPQPSQEEREEEAKPFTPRVKRLAPSTP